MTRASSLRITGIAAASGFALLGGIAAAQTLTLREARTLPAHEVARRALGPAGAIYPEVRRPAEEEGAFHPEGRWGGLTGLTFVSAPRSAGFQGLCEADILHVGFTPIRRPTAAAPDPPARPSRLSTDTFYRIVGDAQPRGEWSEAYEGRLERRCADSAPVFGDNLRDRGFFAGTGVGGGDFRAADASFAARALQQALELVDARRVRPDCTPDPDSPEEGLCNDPRRRMEGLEPSSLFRAEIERCSGGTGELCVRAYFVLPESTRSRLRQIVVTIETDATVIDPPPGTFGVRRVRLSGETWVV